MQQALLIIDVQPSFTPMAHRRHPHIDWPPPAPPPSNATTNPNPPSRNNSAGTRHPAPDDDSLIQADRIFIKHGYAPSPQTIEYLQSLKVERVLVCGLQTETCCLAAGFALFDARLQPTLITDLTVGSSLDRTGGLGVRLWEHHFKHTVTLVELHQGLSGMQP